MLFKDCHDSGTEYTFQADLPGVLPQDITVEIDNGCIKVCGERRSMHETESVTEYHMERKFGKVERIIRLPW